MWYNITREINACYWYLHLCWWKLGGGATTHIILSYNIIREINQCVALVFAVVFGRALIYGDLFFLYFHEATAVLNRYNYSFLRVKHALCMMCNDMI